MNGRIQIRQIVVVDPTTLLLMILNQLDGLSDNIAYPEKAEEASQVYITSLEGDLGNFAAKEHAKGVNRQHESWLFVRYVGKVINRNVSLEVLLDQECQDNGK